MGIYEQMKAASCFVADVCTLDPACPFVRDCKAVEDTDDA